MAISSGSRQTSPAVSNTDWTQRPRKIFGVGNLKTGTTSLGAALEILGFNHTHERRRYLLRQVQRGRLEAVFGWADRHDSFEDWPWPMLYEQLDARYPNSLFILTTRSSPEIWLKSMVKHAKTFGPSLGRELFFGFPSPVEHEEHYLECYLTHNQSIRDYFKDRPEQLLEVCWETGDSWEQLCPFVGREDPAVAFPHLNAATNRIRKAGWLKELFWPMQA